jgi:hypothetical protein
VRRGPLTYSASIGLIDPNAKQLAEQIDWPPRSSN